MRCSTLFWQIARAYRFFILLHNFMPFFGGQGALDAFGSNFLPYTLSSSTSILYYLFFACTE
jgi:hypothetical protein